MMTPEQAKQCLITTDYPMDKIIFRASGSRAIGAFYSTATVTIPHGLPFTPLIDFVWSTNPDFSVSYSSDSGPSPNVPTRNNLGIVANSFANSSNISITFTNFQNSAYTIYYRIFCLMPDNASAPTPFTSDDGSDFILNTDNNYTKLFKSGIANLSGSTSVNHELGYIPQVKVWLEKPSGDILPIEDMTNLDASSMPFGGLFGVTLNTQNITINVDSAYNKAHYRIYLDE